MWRYSCVNLFNCINIFRLDQEAVSSSFITNQEASLAKAVSPSHSSTAAPGLFDLDPVERRSDASDVTQGRSSYCHVKLYNINLFCLVETAVLAKDSVNVATNHVVDVVEAVVFHNCDNSLSYSENGIPAEISSAI
jgi:hypothetical protein